MRLPKSTCQSVVNVFEHEEWIDGPHVNKAGRKTGRGPLHVTSYASKEDISRSPPLPSEHQEPHLPLLSRDSRAHPSPLCGNLLHSKGFLFYLQGTERVLHMPFASLAQKTTRPFRTPQHPKERPEHTSMRVINNRMYKPSRCALKQNGAPSDRNSCVLRAP